VPVRLVLVPLLLQAAAERVMRVVIRGSQLEHGAELPLGLVPALDAEVGDAECLADRRLVRLAPLGLLVPTFSTVCSRRFPSFTWITPIRPSTAQFSRYVRGTMCAFLTLGYSMTAS